MYIRPATHSGSWYSSNKATLTRQLDKFFANNHYNTVPGARLLIGPHAGFTFSGDRLAETFKVWDHQECERVFILGPSHHVYFKNYAMVSDYQAYDTPLGPLPIDVEVNKSLTNKPVFKYMSEEADQDEHSFEMHCPFIKYVLDAAGVAANKAPKLVPMMISSMDTTSCEEVVGQLAPYFKDPRNTFVISSDFCHWGARFGYTEYLPQPVDLERAMVVKTTLKLKTLSSFVKLHKDDNAIHESIEYLDKLAMQIASQGDSADWQAYIKHTGNTICGQKPIYLILKLLEAANVRARFKWLGYSQSSAVETYFDSSVSYASGYVIRL